ncbi:APC family permease [Buttiauxella noackiae]|uniref:APC family permease n=1 Tax=Buttiauxella noackiae TaxID=82992 RepID=UPI002355EC39|nr:APC family permease [Buttiauxella noackiae]MCA1920744.1 APC family permease [Buttiauxella noackiae]
MKNVSAEPTLKVALSYKDLVIYGLVFMVIIAPMSIFGFVSKESHGMAPLVYVVGVACMIFTALSYRKMSRRYPIAGSVYAYVNKATNPHIGFLAGWLIMMDYLFAPALLYAMTATWCTDLLPFIPGWVWVAFFMLTNCWVNIRGIENTAKADIFIFSISALALIVFLVVGINYIAHGGGVGEFTMTPFYQPNVINPQFIGTAVTIAALSFLGFDGISTLAEEAKNPTKDIGKAIIAALFIVGGLFILQCYIATLIQPDFMKMDADSAFFDAAFLAGGAPLKIFLLIVNILAVGIANTLAAQAAASRIVFGMARDHFLPSMFAKIHPTYRTPWISTIAIGALSLVLGLSLSIDFLAKLINFGAMSSFIILNISVIWMFFIKEKRRNSVREIISNLLFPLIGTAILMYVWVNFDSATMKIGFTWLVIGIVIGMVKTRFYKRLPKPVVLS